MSHSRYIFKRMFFVFSVNRFIELSDFSLEGMPSTVLRRGSMLQYTPICENCRMISISGVFLGTELFIQNGQVLLRFRCGDTLETLQAKQPIEVANFVTEIISLTNSLTLQIIKLHGRGINPDGL